MNATGPKKRAFAFALSLLLVLQMLVPSASLQAIAEEVTGEAPVAMEAVSGDTVPDEGEGVQEEPVPEPDDDPGVVPATESAGDEQGGADEVAAADPAPSPMPSSPVPSRCARSQVPRWPVLPTPRWAAWSSPAAPSAPTTP